jgi:hypothetical protein
MSAMNSYGKQAAQQVIDMLTSGVTVPSPNDQMASVQVLNPDQMASVKEVIGWIEGNRTVQCYPEGAELYIALLLFDLEEGKSGYDDSPMPKFMLDDQIIAKVREYVYMKANQNKNKN